MANVMEYTILARKTLEDIDEDGIEVIVGDNEMVDLSARVIRKITEENAIEYASGKIGAEYEDGEKYIFYCVVKYITTSAMEHFVLKRKVYSTEEFGNTKLVSIQRKVVQRPQRVTKLIDSL